MLKKYTILIFSFLISCCSPNSSIIVDLLCNNPDVYEFSKNDLNYSSDSNILIIYNGNNDSSKSQKNQSVGDLSFFKKKILNDNTSSLKPIYKYLLTKLEDERTTNRGTKKVNYTDVSYTFRISMTKTINADLKYGDASSDCLIYLEKGVEDGTTDWSYVGKYFDETINPKMINIFGIPSDIDNNNKIVILYLDLIKNIGIDEKYTLGFFNSFDLVENSGFNNMEIFYLNINWNETIFTTEAIYPPSDIFMLKTLIHEYQHLINYSQRRIYNTLPLMENWLNEALSENAEELVTGTPNLDRFYIIQKDEDKKIRNGKSIFIWESDVESYALSYTFLKYCRLNYKSESELFTELINSPNGNSKDLQNLLINHNEIEITDFDTIIRNYHITNFINSYDCNSSFSYKNNLIAQMGSLSNYKTDVSQNIYLMSGGALYFKTEKNLNYFNPSNYGENIRFVTIQ